MNTIEVVYAEAAVQKKVILQLENGVTVADAIRRSGLLTIFPHIDLQRNGVGIHGRQVAPDKVVQNGDRVEIYCALQKSPAEQRRERAQTGQGDA